MDDSSLTVSHSTQSTFQHNDVGKVWNLEDVQWKTTQDKFPDYKFPQLEHSQYTGCNEEVNKPVVIQDMKWSCDGTSITTVSNDTGIRQYLIPEESDDISDCDDSKDNMLLTPFIRKFKNRSIVSSEIHPLNSMYDEKYNFALLSSRDIPIQMYNLSSENNGASNVRYTYNIVNSLNETFEVPYSIKILPSQNDIFYTGGSGNKIKIYDMTRSSPVSEYYSRRGRGSKSIISCFEDRTNNYVMNDKVIIWANYKNEIGILDTRCDPNDSRAMNSKHTIPRHAGDGIYQVIRSDNDHYLYVLLRRANKIQVFDHRGTFKPMNTLWLPFKSGYQKHMAIIDEDQGLVLGSDQGTLLNWDKSLIGSGGLAKDGADSDNDIGFTTMKTEGLPVSKNAKIHMISRNPSNESTVNSYAIATSSDRNHHKLPSRSPPQSSLSILTHTD